MTRTQSPTSTATSTSAAIIASISEEVGVPMPGSRPWHVASSLQSTPRRWQGDSLPRGTTGCSAQRKATAARVYLKRRLRDLGIDIGTQGVIAWLRLPKS
jgi:hypothetical protein